MPKQIQRLAKSRDARQEQRIAVCRYIWKVTT